MGVAVYGIPNCDTVRRARAWLATRGVAHAFHDLKKITLDAWLLQGWRADLGDAGAQLVNRRGTTWRGLCEAQRATEEAQALDALMIAHPSVIRRPVLVVDGHVAAVGFTPESYATLFAEP